MNTYETSYGPDMFDRVRMGMVNEIYLCYKGYERPALGDLLTIKNRINQIAVNQIVMKIAVLVDCPRMKETVLIKLEPLADYTLRSSYVKGLDFHPVSRPGYRYVDPVPLEERMKNHRAMVEAAEKSYFEEQKEGKKT